MSDRRLEGSVRIVGSGLLGASIGLGLTARGVDVIVDDASPSNARLAIDYGAGRAPRDDDAPALIVVCVPPDVTAQVVGAELAAHPDALVTDVASVKLAPLRELESAGADLSRYLGTHPMAGREIGGPAAARADLFLGRPWVLAGHDAISYRRAAAIEDMILDLGAVPVEMTVAQHDASVALVSHAPQVVSSLLAARLTDGDNAALALAGQGVRDVTRVAGSDPGLWLQILSANAVPVAAILRALRDDLDVVVDALERIGDERPDGARRAIVDALAAGNAGVARLPGKHGKDARYASLVVLIDDRPGQLARLFAEIGDLGVNLEDLRLEHSPGAPIGIVEVSVLPEAVAALERDLIERGWRIAG
ncbi:prephenate dehydrogenase [Herbiconiux sp. L3-i23]|uniref:prephenate dehydrogenase n=1 Tax=Herbiconiux sp. L3-i23 TaxID=2905871 RepID=UPI002055E024|nr:prephenate dehydrogenase [Herbiconiux sp. L3-i23]BDI22272.1 prephenate dehydrogenase [Herbiconiux sp. L3-i23]